MKNELFLIEFDETKSDVLIADHLEKLHDEQPKSPKLRFSFLEEGRISIGKSSKKMIKME